MKQLPKCITFFRQSGCGHSTCDFGVLQKPSIYHSSNTMSHDTHMMWHSGVWGREPNRRRHSWVDKETKRVSVTDCRYKTATHNHEQDILKVCKDVHMYTMHQTTNKQKHSCKYKLKTCSNKFTSALALLAGYLL